jgi:hypothetical protein
VSLDPLLRISIMTALLTNRQPFREQFGVDWTRTAGKQAR